jgi:hypothetical protein
VADVEEALRKWGRYVVLNGTSQSPDLVLIVPKGRVAETMASVSVHTGSDSRTTVGSIAETEMGSAQDMLALYEAPLESTRHRCGARCGQEG